ncbi:MAG: hypothetical protein V9E83_03745, partial [Baekduia sp.]
MIGAGVDGLPELVGRALGDDGDLVGLGADGEGGGGEDRSGSSFFMGERGKRRREDAKTYR